MLHASEVGALLQLIGLKRNDGVVAALDLIHVVAVLVDDGRVLRVTVEAVHALLHARQDFVRWGLLGVPPGEVYAHVGLVEILYVV